MSLWLPVSWRLASSQQTEPAEQAIASITLVCVVCVCVCVRVCVCVCVCKVKSMGCRTGVLRGAWLLRVGGCWCDMSIYTRLQFM